ncbi:MAG: dihydroorotase [Alphaproteobacteria bacterium]|nr:dihydroorotase [Alphaproteobacteria bacterium]
MTAVFFNKIHVCDPSSGRDEISSVLVKDGMIEAIGSPQSIGSPPKDATIIEAQGAVLAPGLVDMRVQSRNPGYTHQESPTSLAQAAAAGGITSMVCLPNTNPVLDNPDSLAALMRHNTDRIASPRLYAYGAATKGLDDEAMAELGLLAEAGAVGFTNATKPIADSLIMRRIMDYAAMLDKPIIQHAEDISLARDGEMNESVNSTRLGLRGIPAEAEEIMVARALIRQAKADGLSVTCDTAPPYFGLNDLAVMEYDTRFRLSPPLRSEDDRQAVLEGIADGTIDAIASDHAPQDRDSKLLPFGIAATGASALETLLPLVMGLYHQGVISLMRVFELTSSVPATLLDLPGGSLSQGATADMVVVAPDRSWQIRGKAFKSLSHSTPFEGQPVQGKVLSTWVDGVMIYADGE